MSDRALHVVVTGTVQGVGFRPYVLGVARSTRCRGVVKNTARGVEIDVIGDALSLEAFVGFLWRALPPARVHSVDASERAPFSASDFRVLTDDTVSAPAASLAPDLAPCAACLDEVLSSSTRRARYPFTSCARCGPRASVAKALPWERASTTMAPFAMCAGCAHEYTDASDRRFRAETIACPDCGPKLQFSTTATDARAALGDDALVAACAALASGQIVAVKGVGGFQLLADATRDDVIARLRVLKRRPTKPFALLVATPENASAIVTLDDVAMRALTDPSAPIVLAPHKDQSLAARVAPLRRDVGVMLPSSPLHALLARSVFRPLVVTSANTSGAPIPSTDAALDRSLADGVLTHDRDITRPLDDGIVRIIAGRARPVRAGRGHAPHALALPSSRASGTLALGCHEKTAPALAAGAVAFLGAHVGDLDTHAARSRLVETARDLTTFFGTEPHALAVDMHPEVGATHVARTLSLPVTTVPHHVAHAAALLAEHGVCSDARERALVFTWDGTGLGSDGTLWGGDALLIEGDHVRRVARTLSFPLLGGDHAVVDVRRQALAACLVAGGPALVARARTLFAQPFSDDETRALTALSAARAQPRAASVGRLFDVLAALLGFPLVHADEGHAAAFVEDLASDAPDDEHVHFEISLDDEPDALVVDWRNLLTHAVTLLERRPRQETRAAVARAFHDALVDGAARIAERYKGMPVGLTGGSAVNRLLVEGLQARIHDRPLLVARMLPSGDGALAYGQLAARAFAWRS